MSDICVNRLILFILCMYFFCIERINIFNKKYKIPGFKLATSSDHEVFYIQPQVAANVTKWLDYF